MPEAAKNYSITELEMFGLAINIASFAHLLKRVDCDAIVYHLVIMHIMKGKMEPTTNRIKRLLELLMLCKAVQTLSAIVYLFSLYEVSRGFAHYFFICTELTQLCSFFGFTFLHVLGRIKRVAH